MKRTTQIVQDKFYKKFTWMHMRRRIVCWKWKCPFRWLSFFFQCVYIKWTQTNIIHYSTCINLTSKRIFIFYFYVFVHKRDINKFGTRNVLLSTERAVNHTLSRQCLELYRQVTIETRQCRVIRMCVVDITTEFS